MREINLPPKASSLTESMRDIGYSLEAAIADIIDNSITASASKVNIWFDTDNKEIRFAISDNGKGINEKELIEAMRHGSCSPKDERSPDDLGRFGLGLKTASFSQCRKLTVISNKNENHAGAVWDLDMVADRDDWVVSVLEKNEIINMPYFDKIADNGTLVLWEKIDRLYDGEINDIKMADMYGRIDNVEKHLSLVFHRFLNGEIQGRKLAILINDHEVKPFDPFCINNKATQVLREEIIRINGKEVRIQPYILPHHSRLSQKESDYYKSRSDFLNNQGAYIYRNGRLMSWGDWLRLVPKGEATKLARVKIDFPSSLDDKWTIDVKKSRAYPPFEVRERLRQIIGQITDQSTKVHSGRSRIFFEENIYPLWHRYADNNGIKYSLNMEHPLLGNFKNSLANIQRIAFKEIISVIAASIPVEAIYSDYSMNPKDFEKETIADKEETLIKIEALWQVLSQEHDIDEDSFKDIIYSLKPFCDLRSIVEDFIGRKYNV
jgi:hypothetical protein